MKTTKEIFQEGADSLKNVEVDKVSSDYLALLLADAKRAGITSVYIQIGGHLTGDEDDRPNFIREVCEGRILRTWVGADKAGVDIGVDYPAGKAARQLVGFAQANHDRFKTPAALVN